MHDVVVIGAGPGGLTAGIFAVRRELSAVVLNDPESLPVLTEATVVDDWPGVKGKTGMELQQAFEKHAKELGVEIKFEKALDIKKTGYGFDVRSSEGLYHAKTVIIATGAKHRRANVPGEEKLAGKGVSYCASCDGPLFKGKRISVIGGGDSAATYALLLDQIGADVSLIHRRDELRAVETYRKQINNSKVKTVWNTILKEIKGEDKVTSIVVQNVKTKKEEEIPMDGVFVAIGSVPLTELGKVIGLEIDGAGYIKVDRHQRTNVPGVFAAGDCCDNPTKRIVTACSDGSKAAEEAYEYIQSQKVDK